MKTLREIIKPYRPSKKNLLLLGVAFAVSVSLIVITAYHERYALGSDGISYISIAEQYVRGELATAVNGYWSPAVSWILVPFIKLGIDAQLAFVAINGLSAVIALVVGSGLVWRYSRANIIVTLLFMLGTTLLAVNSMGELFPDMMVVAWSTIFIAAMMISDFFSKKGGLKTEALCALTIGLIGAIGYLTKLYLAPFFVGVVVLWTVAKLFAYTSGPLRKRLRSPLFLVEARLLIMTGAFFVIFCAPWIVALSAKYNYPTFGSSFAINTAPSFKRPRTNNVPSNQHEGKSSMLAIEEKMAELPASPPHEKAVTTTEDRTPKNGSGASVGVRQSSALTNFVKKKSVTVPAYIRTLQNMWVLMLPIVFISGALLATKRPKLETKRHYYLTLMSFLVYFCGYAMVTGNGGGNPRYFWPMVIFSLFLTCFLAGDLMEWSRQRTGVQRVLVVVTILCVTVTLVSAYPMSWKSISRDTRLPRLEEIAREFESQYNPHEFDDYLSNNGRENRTFAYYVNGQAYGTLGANHQFTDKGMITMMNKRGIDYFLHFSPSSELEFKPEDYDGRLLVRYDLGADYRRCLDVRAPGNGSQCYLYILKPIYR